MHWSVGSDAVVMSAANTYSLSGDSAFERSRSKVMRLVPRSCGYVTLKVALMGIVRGGSLDTFTLYRAPGGQPDVSRLASTGFSCELQSSATTCEVRGPLDIEAWDALEMVWTTNGGSAAMGAPIAVSLACE